MSDNDNYMGVLLEEIRDQNKAVLEAVGDMQRHVQKIPVMQEQLERVETKVDTIQAAVTDTNRDLADLDSRVIIIEQAA
ncbi:MAG TPA: hypothetical protein VNE40_03325 [Candidatus Dormibacteraeota bacterium]|nr:hypothetical protein [Candidatus Dormibacteraeota bacterium]